MKNRVLLPFVAIVSAAALQWPSAAVAEQADKSGSSEDKPVAAGRVTDEAGAPLPGRKVTLMGWPSNDVLGTLVEGDSFKLQPLAETVTNDSGDYVLPVPSVGALRALASKDGLINLDVVTAGGDQPTKPASFGRRIKVSGDKAILVTPESDPAGGESQAAETERADLKASRKTETAQPQVVEKGCTSSFRKDYGSQVVHVGQAYAIPAGVTTDFQYNSGSASTVGVGYSVSGAYGSFKKNGTHTISSSGTIDFPTQVGYKFKHFRTNYKFGLFYVTCFDAFTGQSTGAYYNVRPTSWVGGSSEKVLSGGPTANYCTRFLAGSRFTKETSSAIEWAFGAELNAVIGVNMSVKTGYSTAAKTSIYLPQAYLVCGTHDYPGSSPQQLFTKH